MFISKDQLTANPQVQPQPVAETTSSKFLTQEEIDAKRPKPPSYCTPRQFRLALIDAGYDLNQIQTMLENIPNEVERSKALVEWEYSITIERNHPLIQTFATQLNLSVTNLDNIFFLTENY